MRVPILLVRHAVGYHNLAYDDKCLVEFHDALLTPSGKKEARLHAPYILEHVSGAGPVQVFVSPLRRCLQTCAAMLSEAEKSTAFHRPVGARVLMEYSSYKDSAGHPVGYLKRHFPWCDWNELEQCPQNWWSRSYRLDTERSNEALKYLRDKARYGPVVAFSHGNIINRMTGHSLHNCEGVISVDNGKSWRRIYLGRSPSRDSPRRRMC